MATTLCITNLQGTLVYASDLLPQRLGYDVAEAVGKKPSQLWGGHARRHVYDYLWQKLEAKQPAIVPVINKTKSGKAIEESIHVAPVLDDAGKTQYYLELHPTFFREKKRQAFQQEFLRVFSSDQQVDTTAWMRQWIPELSDGQLADVLAEQLIAPIAQRFSARKEDDQLVRNAQSEPAAFAFLYNKYHDPIYRYFLKRLGSKEKAEELTQDTFLRAFTHLASYRLSNANYYTYLSRIAHNLLVNVYRKQDALFADQEVLDAFPAKGEKTLWQRMMLFRAMRKLTPIEQRVVEMKYHERESIKEIASELGKTENAIKLHLSRARKKLKITLES